MDNVLTIPMCFPSKKLAINTETFFQQSVNHSLGKTIFATLIERLETVIHRPCYSFGLIQSIQLNQTLGHWERVERTVLLNPYLLLNINQIYVFVFVFFLLQRKTMAGKGKGAGGSGGFNILWTIVWFVVLIMVGLWIAPICAGFHILLQPFSVCLEGCGVRIKSCENINLTE